MGRRRDIFTNLWYGHFIRVEKGTFQGAREWQEDLMLVDVGIAHADEERDVD